jgi:hypothetical protein
MKTFKSKSSNLPCSDASIFSTMAAVELGEMRADCISKRARGGDLMAATNDRPTKKLNLDLWLDVVPGDDQGQN